MMSENSSARWKDIGVLLHSQIERIHRGALGDRGSATGCAIDVPRDPARGWTVAGDPRRWRPDAVGARRALPAHASKIPRRARVNLRRRTTIVTNAGQSSIDLRR